MIYTVTLNPAIDFLVYLDEFRPGEINRIQKERKYPGGKGINVSRMLSEFKTPSTALGFIGGFTGDFIEKELQGSGIRTDFIKVDEDTRINIKLKSNIESEINGKGPDLKKEQIDDFLKAFDKMTKKDLVVLSGSKPHSLPKNFYQTIIDHLQKKEVPFVIDTTGEELMNALSKKPFLIKPNHIELDELFQQKSETLEDRIELGRKLIEKGAQNLILSMGGDGSLFFTKNDVYKAEPIHGKVINTVGSGDSMVGAFIGKYSQTKDLVLSYKYAALAGSATAFTEDLASLEQIEELFPQINITKL